MNTIYIYLGLVALIVLIFIASIFHLVPFLNPSLATFISVLIILIFKRYTGLRWEEMGFMKLKPNDLFLALGIALILSFSFLLFFIPFFENLLKSKLDFSLFENLRGNTNLFLIGIPAAWILAAFGEEIIFRGFFISVSKNLLKISRGKLWIPVIFSSIFFGFCHNYQGITGMIVTALVGFILAIIFIRKNFNLSFLILIHGFIDTIYFTIFYLSIDKYL